MKLSLLFSGILIFVPSDLPLEMKVIKGSLGNKKETTKASTNLAIPPLLLWNYDYPDYSKLTMAHIKLWSLTHRSSYKWQDNKFITLQIRTKRINTHNI